MEKTMIRLTCATLACALILSISPSFAESSVYHGERRTPEQQYQRGSVNQSVKKNNRVYKQEDSFFGKKEKNIRSLNSDRELSVSLETGYRTSQLKWNIAGNSAGTSPNILSELQWEDINGYQFEPKVEYTQKTGRLKGLNLQASLNKSITTSGKNQDSDYLSDDRADEFSRSNNSSDVGHAEGFSASIGYAFDFADDRRNTIARFTALVGYAQQNQQFAMRDGVQTLSAFGFPVPLGPFPGLRSSYDMELRMPFVGAELTTYFADTHHLKIRGRYTIGDYNGVGNWNLRSDFMHPKSFEQKADGSGFLLGAEYGWQMYPQTQLTVSANYNYFKTDHGTDTVYFSDGTIGRTRFNEAEWSSLSYLAGLNYRF